jgi:glycine/D-amino acid oxidase-like deaminating enzyme
MTKSERPRGLLDMSVDRLVHAGDHDGQFYAVGYSGYGGRMATYMARRMA